MTCHDYSLCPGDVMECDGDDTSPLRPSSKKLKTDKGNKQQKYTCGGDILENSGAVLIKLLK